MIKRRRNPERGESEDPMANINEIRSICDAIRNDAHEVVGKISMAIAMEDEFINGCKAVIGRFQAEDKSSKACRMACYDISGTENYHELRCILEEHEKTLKKLTELQSFVGGWEVNFR